MKNTFTRKEVIDILHEFAECYDIWDTEQAKINFELWLNDQWLNWNNGANEDKFEAFMEAEIESFIY